MEEMWKTVKDDTTLKSTLFLLDAEDQLNSIKPGDNEDPKTHLTELKQHFQLMIQQQDNLLKMGSVITDTCFNIIIMSSLLDLYCPTLQTITAAERASRLSGSISKGMSPNDLIAFIVEEAQHQVINNECTKTAESALAACTKKVAKPRGKGRNKSKNTQSDSHVITAMHLVIP